MKLGTLVTIERDEKKYPSKGSWPQFRGRNGFVDCNVLGEIGVKFSKNDEVATFFQPYEVKVRKR